MYFWNIAQKKNLLLFYSVILVHWDLLINSTYSKCFTLVPIQPPRDWKKIICIPFFYLNHLVAVYIPHNILLKICVYWVNYPQLPTLLPELSSIGGCKCHHMSKQSKVCVFLLKYVTLGLPCLLANSLLAYVLQINLVS